MTESRQREESLFAAALEFPRAQRGDYLDRACAGDAALRARIEALLAGHEQTDGILDQPTDAVTRPTLRPGPQAEKPGDQIGPYKLLQPIGEGGAGVVWMAEQEAPVRRRVALKVIKLGMDTRQVVARFEAERQALALMDHPNIAKVLDAGATEKGRPFFVMELVRGLRITDFCDQHQLSTEQRLGLFTQVCQAIQHAHQKGIIHRDLKPSNILVADHDGVPVPKVIDFGIAKATTDQRLTDKTLFTAFEQFIGTPAYMSPEQANFSGLDVDTRTDIYSLGVLLYELLTGKTPFDAKELLRAGLDEMRRTIREREPVRPSTRLSTMQASDLTTTAQHRRTEVPKLIQLLRGDLDWIVMKCLEKDRARRYETANGLALDVQRYLRHELVVARPPSAAYRFQKLVQRNRLAVATAATIAVTVLLAFVFLLFSNARTSRERNQKAIALQEKAAALDAAQSSEQRAREELFTSLKNQARARRYSRQLGQRLDSFAAIAQATQIRPDASLRDEAIAAMALPDIRRGPKWQVSRSNCVALACDAMGQRYAVLDAQGAVAVRRIEDNREIYRFEAGPACAECYPDLAFSPDGAFLAKVGDGYPPFVWSLDTGEAILQDAPLGAGTPAFSANRRFVAFADNEDVFCFDLATGREANHWRTLGRVHALQFHPTAPRIAVGYKEGPWLSVHDTTDGKEISRLEVGTGWRMVVSWHPDGRHLAVGSTALGIQVWDVEAQRRVARLESHAHETDFLSFHPSGNWLASWSWDEVVRLWEPMTEREVIQFPSAARLQFSRDGRWLGFFWADNDHVQLLEFVSPQEYYTLQDNSGAGRAAPKAAATSPDDRLLAVATADGTGLWDFPARREIARLPSGATDAVVFEADGRALWTCGKESGLQRWEVNRSGTNTAGLQFGPPQRIELPFAPLRFASDSAVRTLAVVNEDPGQAMVVDLATRTARVLPVPHPKASHVALSPNGKWLATSGWHSDRVQLWNLEVGELAQEWVVGLQTKIAFAPDNRELIVARDGGFEFLNVETLATSRGLRRDIALYPGGVAFSPDGKLMATEMAPAVIHLAEISTGRTVAQLADPFGDRPDAISFSRDGSKLITVSTYAAAVHIWDLHAVRSRLKAMGLDWDWPEFSQ